jgi:SAM-dependent methyltransferase
VIALACPACGGDDHCEVLRLSGVPVLPNAACASSGEARSVTRGDIDLAVCLCCGHLYNRTFDPGQLRYDARYENSLGFSPSFAAYAATLADRLTGRGWVKGRIVAELGSGPGEFLALLAERGAVAALGFDPSYDPQRMARPSHPAVRIEAGTYPLDGSARPELLVARHVLEHLEEPVGVLSGIVDTLAPSAGAYLEVPNARSMVERFSLWDLIYEHPSYFAQGSLQRLLERAGLAVEECWSDYDDQFLCAAATPAKATLPAPHRGVDAAWLAAVESFGRAAQRLIDDERQRLAELGQRGPVALWGAGSKGIMYCNLVAAEDALDVIDVNPRKNGTFVAGTGHEVNAPEGLRRREPTTVLVSNPLYAAEIRAQLADLAPRAQVELLWT